MHYKYFMSMWAVNTPWIKVFLASCLAYATIGQQTLATSSGAPNTSFLQKA